MARYKTCIQTGMPVDSAFAFMADLRNFERWDPGVSSSHQVTGDGPAVGACYAVIANGTELVYSVTDFDYPHRIVAEANTDRLRSYDVITVEERDGGSLVAYDATLTLKGGYRILEPLMALLFRRIGSRADRGLQQALDGKKVG